MRALAFKLGHVLVPFLLLAVGFIAIYSAVNYGLVIATGWIPIDRNVANAWLPVALGLVLTSVIVSPRLRVLKPDKDGDTPFYFYVVAAAVLIVPTIWVQYWLTAETGKLIHVEQAHMIGSAPAAAYYTATTVCVDKNSPVVTERSELSGRNNEDLDFKLYVLTPTCPPAGRPVWIAQKYSDYIKSDATKAAKLAKYKAFVDQSQAEYNGHDFGKATYFESMARTTDRRIYEKALVEHHVAESDTPIILIPHQDAFADRGGNKLKLALISFGAGVGLFLFLLLIRGLVPDEVDQARLPKSVRKPAGGGFLQMFIPRPDNYGLPILLDLNVGVYVAMVLAGLGVISFQPDDLLDWGANYGPYIHGLGAYRLITSQFVHGGMLHIISNMYGLIFGGLLLSPVLRKWGLILSYLFCGLAASLASEMTHPKMVAIGASGAIMGLFGILVMLAILGDRRVVGARLVILMNVAIFAGLTLFVGAATPGVDNAAHVAGLVAGMVLALPIFAFGWGEPEDVQIDDEALQAEAAPGPIVEEP